MPDKVGRDYWQATRDFRISVRGASCAVCGSNWSCGFGPDLRMVDLCEFHSKLTLPALDIILRCKRARIFTPDVPDAQISCIEFNVGRWNNYDRDSMLPYFEDQLLINKHDIVLKNCCRIHRPASTYEEAAQLYATELALRLAIRAGFVERVSNRSENALAFARTRPQAVADPTGYPGEGEPS